MQFAKALDAGFSNADCVSRDLIGQLAIRAAVALPRSAENVGPSVTLVLLPFATLALAMAKAKAVGLALGRLVGVAIYVPTFLVARALRIDWPQPRVDRLSFLPAELIARIFRFVYEDPTEPFLGPISQHLWPFTEALLYNNVRLLSAAAFDAFARTVLDPSWPSGALVRGLCIEIEEADGTRAATQLASVLTHLPDVLSIAVISDPCSRVAIAPSVSLASCQNLRSLVLCFDTMPSNSMFNPLSHSAYPNLQHLHVVITCSSTTPVPPDPDVGVDAEPITSIHALSFTSTSQVLESPSGVRFVGRFRGLSQLQLTAGGLSVDLRPLLVVADPDIFALFLFLLPCAPTHPLDFTSYASEMSRFKNLGALILGSPLDPLPPSSLLAHIPPSVQILSLEPGSTTKASDLLDILRRPSSRLRYLHLNHFPGGTLGTPLTQADTTGIVEMSEAAVRGEEAPVPSALSSWIYPTFVDSWERSAAEGLIGEARRRGVGVTGSVLDAVMTSRVFEKQLEVVFERAEWPKLQGERERGVVKGSAEYWRQWGEEYLTGLSTPPKA